MLIDAYLGHYSIYMHHSLSFTAIDNGSVFGGLGLSMCSVPERNEGNSRKLSPMVCTYVDLNANCHVIYS